MTIPIRQDLANVLEETVQSQRYDREGDVSNDALIQLRPGLDAAVTTDKMVEIDLAGEPSDDRTSRHDPAGIALENQSPFTGAAAGADAPSIDEEEIVSEVDIRERLIEWLVGFLPG